MVAAVSLGASSRLGLIGFVSLGRVGFVLGAAGSGCVWQLWSVGQARHARRGLVRLDEAGG